MTRPLPASIQEDKNKLDGADPFIWLMALQVNAAQIFRVCANPEQIIYGGEIYYPMNFMVGDMNEDGQGNPSSVSISVSNIPQDGSPFRLSHLVEDNRGFTGKRATLMWWHLGDVVAMGEFPVMTCDYNDEAIQLTIGNADVFAQTFPRRRYTRDRCGHEYKGELCAYAGGLVSCDKTLGGINGCFAHANVARFGGAPALRRQ